MLQESETKGAGEGRDVLRPSHRMPQLLEGASHTAAGYAYFCSRRVG
jgi:hypothetical protein